MIVGFIVIGLVVIGLTFYFSSMKYFHPSEIVAISTMKRSTGETDIDGNPIYKDFIYQRGGRLFIPLWRDYYVLPTHLVTSSISTQKFLTKDKLHIRADFVVQYHIDVSSSEKMEEAFTVFADLVKRKGIGKDSNISNIFASHFEKLFLGTIPEILGKMKLDEIIEDREIASKKLLRRVSEDFEQNSLCVVALKIETVHIENREFFEKLEKTIATKQQIELDKEINKARIEREKLKVEMAKTENDVKNENAKNKQDEIKRKIEEEKENFKLESAQIEFNAQLKRKKIEENKLLQDSHKEEEEYNKSLILSQLRAKKEAELIVQNIDLKITETINAKTRIENETKALNIKGMNEAMKETNGYASLLIMLEHNPTLIKQLFGKNGLSRLANSVTQHLANIESINLTDFGGGSEEGGLNPLERFGYMIPTLISQTISKLNRVGIAQTLTDIGVDKVNIDKLKENEKIIQQAKEMMKKAGIENTDEILEDFVKGDTSKSENSQSKLEDIPSQETEKPNKG